MDLIAVPGGLLGPAGSSTAASSSLALSLLLQPVKKGREGRWPVPSPPTAPLREATLFIKVPNCPRLSLLLPSTITSITMSSSEQT